MFTRLVRYSLTLLSVFFYNDLEKIKNLREMNLSYNRFSGAVSKHLADLDKMHLTMVNDQGTAVALEVKPSLKSNTAIAEEE